MHAESLSRVQLCNLMDQSPSGFSFYGILQARILEWAAMLSSMESSQSRFWMHISYVSCIASGFFTTSATWETPWTVSKQPTLRFVKWLVDRYHRQQLFQAHSRSSLWQFSSCLTNHTSWSRIRMDSVQVIFSSHGPQNAAKPGSQVRAGKGPVAQFLIFHNLAKCLWTQSPVSPGGPTVQDLRQWSRAFVSARHLEREETGSGSSPIRWEGRKGHVTRLSWQGTSIRYSPSTHDTMKHAPVAMETTGCRVSKCRLNRSHPKRLHSAPFITRAGVQLEPELVMGKELKRLLVPFQGISNLVKSLGFGRLE